VRLHNIKKAVLTEAPEEKSHSPNLDQLKTELLDCIQLQMTSQFDALKAEIAGLALARAADDVTEPAAKRRKTDQSASTEPEPALVESLRAQIEQLTRQQQTAHEEADKARQTNESLNHMMAELKKLKDEDRTRADKLSDENRTLSEQVAALEAQHAQLVRTSETSAEHERVKEQLAMVQDELGKARDELTAVRARAEAADRQLEVSEQRVVELDQLFRDQCAETTRAKDENAKLQQECDKLKTVAKQLYLKIKNSASTALSTSGALAASTEGSADEQRQ
jgi:DNA repair ATPase RecN